MPKVSVIIPVYNVADYLRDCLDSVRRQTLVDIEIICVDDGSTDGSERILDEVAASDGRIRVIHLGHTNAGHCRNVGLDMSTGSALSFLDADDLFADDLLETLFAALCSAHADVAACKAKDFVSGREAPQLRRDRSRGVCKEYVRPALHDDFFSLWGGRAWDKLFRSEFVRRENLRFQEIRSTNDALFVYSALALSEKIVDLGDCLIAHRRHGSSLEATRSQGVDCVVKMIRAFNESMRVRKVFTEDGVAHRYFLGWLVNTMIWYVYSLDTGTAFVCAYGFFRDLIREFGLDRFRASDLPSVTPSCYEMLQRICREESPIDWMWSEMKELPELRQRSQELARLQKTRCYRLLKWTLPQ